MEDNKLGRYEVRGTLGKGAMGTVYDCWDPVVLRRVAIKTVKLPDPNNADAQEELARFRIEAQAGGRLNHPNICGIFDYGETATFAFIVMEYIDGNTLKSFLDKEERFPISETVRVMEGLLAGLQFSHDRQVVHRDIKPANVMLTSDGQVKIADFGIARIESGHLTQAGAVLGTPAYMSPEQFMGNPVDNRTDIYSSGVMLYQMLTGERPFEGGFSAIMHKALNTQPPRPSDLSVAIPGGFDAVVQRAMAKRPDDRYATAADFSRAVREALDHPAPRTVVPAPAWDDATLNSQTGMGLGADDGLMTTMTAATQTSARTVAPSTASAPLPAPVARSNRTPIYIGVGALALALAGAGGWFATRSSPEPTPKTSPQFAVADNTRPAVPEATPPAAVAAPDPARVATPAARPVPAAPTIAAVTAPPIVPTVAPPPPAVGPANSAPVQMAMAPPPAVPAPPPAAVVPPPVPKAALAAALATIPCTMVGGDVTQPDETVLLTGLVHVGAPEAGVRKVLADIAPTARLNWQITTFDGPYCKALDMLRPLAARFGATSSGFVLALAGDRSRLQDGDLITLHLTTPDFPADLQVDYLQHDNSVYHMHPTPTDPVRVYPPGSRQSLGDPTAGGARWEVSEPYGTEIITAIASTVPLFARNRPESETNDAYLKDLQVALDAAKKRGAKFAVGAVILNTEPKKTQ